MKQRVFTDSMCVTWDETCVWVLVMRAIRFSLGILAIKFTLESCDDAVDGNHPAAYRRRAVLCDSRITISRKASDN
eukprot:886725-Prorocentrum_minimum.AAC.1